MVSLWHLADFLSRLAACQILGLRQTSVAMARLQARSNGSCCHSRTIAVLSAELDRSTQFPRLILTSLRSGLRKIALRVFHEVFSGVLTAEAQLRTFDLSADGAGSLHLVAECEAHGARMTKFFRANRRPLQRCHQTLKRIVWRGVLQCLRRLAVGSIEDCCGGRNPR